MKKYAVFSNSLERKLKSIIPSRIKKIVVDIMCKPSIGKLIQLIQPRKSLDGAAFNYRLVDPSTAAKIFFGVWESAEIKILKRNMNGTRYLELGSSVGVTMSVLINASKNKFIKYVGVEASPRNYEILEKQAAYIKVRDSAVLINKAIDYTKNKEIYFVESGYETGSVGKEFRKEYKTVKTIELNEIVNSEFGDLSYFLISDIEGAEAEIFNSDIDALKNCVGILCELEDTEKYSIEDQVDKILSSGFKIKEQYSNVYCFTR